MDSSQGNGETNSSYPPNFGYSTSDILQGLLSEIYDHEVNLFPPALPPISSHEENETSNSDSRLAHQLNSNVFDSFPNPINERSLYRDSNENRTVAEEEEDVDFVAWNNKRTDQWKIPDTIQWLMYAYTKLKQPYGSMSTTLAMPGEQLLRLSKEDFIKRDKKCGKRLHGLLPRKCNSKNSVHTNRAFSKLDGESKTRSGSGDRQSKEPGVKLPDFLRNLLAEPDLYSKLIRWEDRATQTFRVINPSGLAKLWGERPGKNREEDLTYANLSRGIRYWYGSKLASDSKRLVYRFVETATESSIDWI